MRGDILILFILLIIFSACNQNTFDSKEELLSYLTDPDNGFSYKRKINSLDMVLTYRPTDLTIYSQASQSISLSQIDSLRREYGKNIYFSLSLSIDNREILTSLSSRSLEYNEVTNELLFGIGDKVHLFNNQSDTIELLGHVMPRVYGKGKSNNVMLIFPRDEEFINSEQVFLSVEEFGLKTGEVKFRINSNVLRNEPNLIFSNGQ